MKTAYCGGSVSIKATRTYSSQNLAVGLWTIAEEAVGQLVVAGRNGAVDLDVPENAFDPVALPLVSWRF
jgi:hypothetical protein